MASFTFYFLKMKWSFFCLSFLVHVHVTQGVLNKPAYFRSQVNSLIRNAVIMGWDMPSGSELAQMSGYSLVYYPTSSPDDAKTAAPGKEESGYLLMNLSECCRPFCVLGRGILACCSLLLQLKIETIMLFS
eukprot:m.39667 g.39667  ORF g.39667 m.39667 type:complete len:131 (+) comp32784_c0_seq2:239-631(+)